MYPFCIYVFHPAEGIYQFSSVTQLYPPLCDPMDCSTPGFPVHHQAPGAFSNSCPSSQWCHPTILSSVIPFSSCLQSFPASGCFLFFFGVFSNESVLRIRRPKLCSLSFSISPSNVYSGLISFKMDWFYLLAVQGTLKSLLQHHSSKASILQFSAFFLAQLTSIHDYWKNRNFD